MARGRPRLIRRGLSLSAGLEQDGVALGRSAPDRGSARLGTRLGLLGIWRCRQRIAQDLSDPDGQPAAQAQARELSASTELLRDVDADVGHETRTSPPFDPTLPPERPSGLAGFTSAAYIIFPHFTSLHTHLPHLSTHHLGGRFLGRVGAKCPPLGRLRECPLAHLYPPPLPSKRSRVRHLSTSLHLYQPPRRSPFKRSRVRPLSTSTPIARCFYLVSGRSLRATFPTPAQLSGTPARKQLHPAQGVANACSGRNQYIRRELGVSRSAVSRENRYMRRGGWGCKSGQEAVTEGDAKSEIASKSRHPHRVEMCV